MTFGKWLRAKYGKWVIARYLTPRLKAKGYETAISEKRYRELEAEFQASQLQAEGV